jgi:hypothetical protein
MTYVLIGKLQSESFLMVDTVVDNNTETVTEKLYQSITDNNTFIALSGEAILMKFIEQYDDWLFHKGDKLVLCKDSLNLVCQVLTYYLLQTNPKRTKPINVDRNRIYIISEKEVKFIEIKFINNVKASISEYTLKENEMVVCFRNPENLNLNGISSREFSKKILLEHYKIFKDTKHNHIEVEDYFKLGFSFYSSIGEPNFASVSGDFMKYVIDNQINMIKC